MPENVASRKLPTWPPRVILAAGPYPPSVSTSGWSRRAGREGAATASAFIGSVVFAARSVVPWSPAAQPQSATPRLPQVCNYIAMIYLVPASSISVLPRAVAKSPRSRAVAGSEAPSDRLRPHRTRSATVVSSRGAVAASSPLGSGSKFSSEPKESPVRPAMRAICTW